MQLSVNYVVHVPTAHGKPPNLNISSRALKPRQCSNYAAHVQPSTIQNKDRVSQPAQNKTEKKPTTSNQKLIEGAQAVLFLAQGGIAAHNAGKLNAGIPYLISGLQMLANLVARSPNPQRTYLDMIAYLKTHNNEADLAQLVKTAQSKSYSALT